MKMNRELGKRLAELRSALGFTQEEFAGRIRVSKGYITSLEKSRRELNPRLVKLISDAFGVNERWLNTGSGRMFADPRDVNLDEVIALYNQLHPKLQKLVIEQLKTLLEMSRANENDEAND